MASVFSTRRLILVAIGALIALAELDRLVAETLTGNGQTFQISEVVGPLAAGTTSAWEGWASGAAPPGVLIWVHIALDALFVACYVALLLRYDTSARWRIAVGILVWIEILEAKLLMIQAALLFHQESVAGLAIAGAVVSSAKWLTVVILIVMAVRRASRIRLPDGHNAWWRWARAAFHTVGVHRAGAAVVVVLAIISLIPQTGFLEQLPDIQRSWITWDGAHAVSLDPMAMIVALLVAIAVWAALFAMGRVRSELHYRVRDHVRGAPDFTVYVMWFVPAILGTIAFQSLMFVGWVQGDRWRYVDGVAFGVFIGVAVLIPTLSLAIAASQKRKRVAGRVDPGAFRRLDPDAVRRMGDAIATLSIGIVGLGLVRSFVAPALLGLPAYETASSPELVAIAFFCACLTVAGLTLAFFGDAIGNAMTRFARRLARIRGNAAGRWLVASMDPTVPPRRSEVMLRRALTGVAMGALLVLALWPLQVTSLVGALVTTVVILLAWATLLTVTESGLQERRPIDVFRSLGFRAAPILTLFVIVPFLVAQIGGASAVHAIQSGTRILTETTVADASPGDPWKTRPSLGEALGDWVTRSQCVVESSGGSYRPLVIVAAQGGGIRAATWTVDTLRQFLQTGTDCAENSVLLSSGASGGSVGLTLFQGARDPEVTVNTKLLGDQDALSAGLVGTLVTDAIASTTGLRLPSAPGYAAESGWVWQDRAALIQAAWGRNAPQYAERYDFDPRSPTGWLVLNSTAAGSGCRALVSQVDFGIGVSLTDDGSGTKRPNCSAESPGVASMIDIQDYCRLDIDWATAAMMSSRFPVVTPAARIVGTGDGSARCRSLSDLQFVDGGYTENSGLGTLSDIAPELAGLISLENSRRGTAPAIAPFVLYVRNEAGADVSAPRFRPSSELLVPLRALSTKEESLLSDGTWLQRLSDTLEATDVCPATDLSCRRAVTSGRIAVDGGVAVSAPSTRPAIVAPLGWTLSDISRARLSAEATAQARPSCAGDPVVGYGRLGDLLNLMSATPRPCVEP